MPYSASFSRLDAGGLPFELTVGADKSATPGRKLPPRTLFMAAVSKDRSAAGGATGAVSALVEELVNFGATCKAGDDRRQIGTAYARPATQHAHSLSLLQPSQPPRRQHISIACSSTPPFCIGKYFFL